MAELGSTRAVRWLPALALVSACSTSAGSSGGVVLAGSGSTVPGASTPLVVPADADVLHGSAAQGGAAFDSNGRLPLPDANDASPIALLPDAALSAESPPHDDQSGVTLEVVFHPRHVASPPRAFDVSPDGEAKAAKATTLSSSVDLLASGRMRWLLTSRAMPFPPRTEIRSRRDRLGHLLLWPSEGKYRVLGPGALRTAFDEARVDVTPLSIAKRATATIGLRLGERTRVVSLSSAIGAIRLELGAVPEAGQGGPLLCRALVELAGIDPSTSECKDDEVPLFAELTFLGAEADPHAGGGREAEGGMDVEVTSLTKRTDLPPAEAACPPPGAEYQASGLPEASTSILTKDELAALRFQPTAAPRAPSDNGGLVLENGSDQLTYYFLDGFPVAAVPPESSRTIAGAARGHYSGQWRTFLGDRIDAPTDVDVPTKVSNVKTGEAPDAGP